MSALARVTRKLRGLRHYANMRGVIFFVQNRVHGVGPRRRIAGFVAHFLPPVTTPNPQAASEVRQLQEQGYVMFDGILKPHMIEEMRSHLLKSEVFAPY